MERRELEARLRQPPQLPDPPGSGQRLRSALVYVNGRRVAVRSGRRLQAPIELRGLPRGTARVKIVAITRGGRRITTVRSYHTCVRQPRSRRRARRN